MNRWHAVIFDLDGLLADTEPLHMRAFNLILRATKVDHEFETKEYGRHFVGISVRENSEYIRERFALPQSADDITACHREIFGLLVSDASNLATMPGFDALWAEINRRGIATAIASGTELDNVNKILRGLALADAFRCVSAGSGLPPKPAPDIYLRAIQALGVDPSRILALEDSHSGVHAAKAAGLSVIAVKSRFTESQDLSGADAVVENLADVVSYLGQREKE